MLRNKRFITFLISLLVGTFVFAQASSFELSDRYLAKAEAALDDGKYGDAYKNINAAMSLSKSDPDDVVPANILFLARTIYKTRLKVIQQKFDELDFIEIKSDLEKYPEVSTSELQKLVRQIEAKAASDAKLSEKNDQKKFLDKIEQSSKATTNAIAEMTKTAAETQEIIIQQGTRQEAILKDTDSKFSKLIALFVVVVVIILMIVLLIVVIVRISAKNTAMQQAQYAEAFRLLASNQSQTNQLMLGGITGLYGNDGLKLAGSSTWSQPSLPEPEETPEEKEELRNLAAKCEDIGSRIDQVTGRKNNSKNVSELVYKLALRLGVSQHESMVYFCAAMVYDVGFLSCDADLLAAENISDAQRNNLNRHVDRAVEHLQFVPKRYWEVFENAARLHHENMDGSGIPEGLVGEEIPKIARIIRVADSFNALSSKRTYRGGTDKDSAVSILEEQKNIYDPDVIQALKDII